MERNDFNGNARYKCMALTNYCFTDQNIYLEFLTLNEETTHFVDKYDSPVCEVEEEIIVFKISGMTNAQAYNLIVTLQTQILHNNHSTLEFFDGYFEAWTHNGSDGEEGWMTDAGQFAYKDHVVYHESQGENVYRLFQYLANGLLALNNQLDVVKGTLYEPDSKMRHEKLKLHVAHSELCVYEDLLFLRPFLAEYVLNTKGFHSRHGEQKFVLETAKTIAKALLGIVVKIEALHL